MSTKLYNENFAQNEQLGFVGDYVFDDASLAVIQQVYEQNNRYIINAKKTGDDIFATCFVSDLLGIERPLSYVTNSTISAILSQCCGLMLWDFLRQKYPDPDSIYTRLCEKELVGWGKERCRYRSKLYREIEYPVDIKVLRGLHRGELWIWEISIVIEGYVDSRVRAYKFLSLE